MDNEKFKREIQHYIIGLFSTTLNSAVDREAHIDKSGLGRRVDEQKHYKEIIYSMEILYLYSYFESHFGKLKRIGDSTDYEINSNNDSVVLKNGEIKNSLIVFKYYRDVLAHNYNGKMFPQVNNNTKEFNRTRKNVTRFSGNIKIRKLYGEKYLEQRGRLIHDMKLLIFDYIDKYN